MAKSPDAFRTISEVADWLGVQAHVLRFWESKFAQVKPIKRAGGRRYYRPADMLLLGGLKKVLHEDGLTIKGAQKLLREKGVSYVADLSQPLDDLTIAVIEGSSTPVEVETEAAPEPPAQTTEPQSEDPDVADVVAANVADEAEAAGLDVPDATAPDPEDHVMQSDDTDEPDDHAEVAAEPTADAFDATQPDIDAPSPPDDPLPAPEDEDQPDLPLDVSDDAEPEAAPMITFRSRHRDTSPPAPASADATEAEKADPMPVEDERAEDGTVAPEEPPKPDRIEVTLVHDHTQIEVAPSALSALAKIKSLSPEQAQDIRPLLARLTRLRASMTNPRNDLSKD